MEGGQTDVPERVNAKLVPIYKNIVGIKRALQRMKEEKPVHTMEDVRKYQQMLDAIDRKRGEFGIFGGSLHTRIPAGQAACREALDQAYDILAELEAKSSGMNKEMKHTYSTLCCIRRRLENMKQQESHSVEDIRHYQQMVDGINNKRVDGIFCGSPQTYIPSGQAQCSEALAQCYELLNEMKDTAQDLNADMRSVLTALLRIREELRGLKEKGGGHMMGDLRRYQVELREIENSQEEGVFCGSLRSGHIPAGQAICRDVLEVCHGLVREIIESSKDFRQDAQNAAQEQVASPQV